jgi:hypothetical protein
MRNENRSKGRGGKQGEINWTFENRPFSTRLTSCGRYSSDTTCHTPVQEDGTEAYIRVSRMFKSHI